MSTKGVTYIKINRIDNEGNDNTLTLQGLTNIRIKYSDIGVKDYPVYTIAEYPDYYLYQLYTTDITSSTDNNILNYDLNVSTGSVSRGATGISPNFFNISDINDDNLGGWNLNTYTFYNTPNTWITLSFDSTDSSTTTYYFASPKFSTSLLDIGSFNSFSSPNGTPHVYYISPGTFQTGDEIKIYYGNISGYTSNNSVFIITSSFNNVIDQVVLEPYTTENFEFSDCNVLYGNVDSYPFNPLYMDVDYSTNGMIAINTNQIISGSATRSTVKPYYYSLERHILPRYEGSENTNRGSWEFTDSYSVTGTDAYMSASPFFLVSEGAYLSSLTASSNIMYGSEYPIPSSINIGDKIFVDQQPQGIPSNGGFKIVTGKLTVPLDTGWPPYAHHLLICEGPFSSGPITPGVITLSPNTFENSNIYPIDTFNPNIFEYKYGTTTFPEIPNASILVMGNILEVADKDNVNVLQQDSPYYEAYNKIISDNFTPNADISDIRQYGDGKQPTLNNLKVLTSDFGPPISPLNAGEITEYWLPTSNLPPVSFSAYAGVVNDNNLIFYNNYGIGGAFEVQLNELGQYITGSRISTTNLANNISSSLQAGERWFVTFYNTNELPNPLDKTSANPLSLINYTIPPQYRQSGTDAQLLLAARGIAEITSASFSPGASGQTLPTCILEYTPSSNFGDLNFGGTNFAGLILWKATIPSAQQGKYVIIDKPAGNNLGPGAIVPPDSNNAINQHFNKITTTYGANTKPPTDQSSK